MKDKEIIDLVLYNKYIRDKNLILTCGFYLSKNRIKFKDKHQKNLYFLLVDIQDFYYCNIIPNYRAKKIDYKKINIYNKTLKKLIGKINQYRLKNWYWDKIILN